MKKSVNDCPLCLEHNTQEYSRDKVRSYFICSHCEIIFVPRDQLITQEQEKQRYDSHQNDKENLNYQNYLKKIVSEILPSLEKEDIGLDFGCGITDLMGQLFKTKSFAVDSFDLYFFPEKNIWKKTYNFIILSEVIEHLRNPQSEMQGLRQILLAHGQLFIKTKLHPNKKELFDNWFYKRDNTHVQFFNLVSLKELAIQLNMNGPELIGEDLYRFTS
jgi:transcription initiation factor TFIIIB Brf1 subunit/transcription initiation factor TFIIB